MSFQGAYRGKRVLVTGHTGFKGSWLCQWLLNLGAEVAGYSVDIPSNPSHFEVLGLPSKLKHQMGDIRDFSAVSKLMAEFKPEFVFHLAAQAIVRASYDDPKSTFDVNLGGTVNLLEASRKTPSVKVFINVTSDKCYENREWEFGYRETDPLGGKDPYSASKACAEIAFSAYARSFYAATGLRSASARAGNVIGGGDWAKDRIVPDLVRAWSAGEAPLIRNPKSTRPWQHVLEPLSGYLWLGALLSRSAEGVNGEAFNFGPPPEVNQTVEELISEMKKTWPEKPWKLDPAGVGAKKEAGLLKVSWDKAWSRTQWQPTLSFEEAVEMTARWYQAYYEGKEKMAAFTAEQIRWFEQMALRKKSAWAGK